VACGRRRSRATPIRALWAALAGLAAIAAGAQVAPVELYNQGVAAFEAGLYAVAARNFRDLVRSAPGAREAVPASFLEALSIFYGAASGPADAAGDGYRRAAERFAAHQRRFPESPYGDQIWYWIGTARLAAGDAGAALTALQRHVDQPAEPPPPYLTAARETQARALEQLGRRDEARAAYDALLAGAGAATDADAAARWLERAGMLLLADGRYAAAADRFRRILSDYPDSPLAAEVLFFVAEAKYFQDDRAAAAVNYRRYLELFPGAAHRQGALFRLARLLLDQGDLAAAQEVAAALDDGDGGGASAPAAGSSGSGTAPAAGAVALLHGDLSAAASDWAAAAIAYDRGLARAGQPDLRQVLNINLALAQVENGNPLQAIASFEEAALGPDAVITEMALYNRAVLLAGEQRMDEAVAALQAFLEQFPDSAHRAAVEALLLDVLERAGDQQALLHLLRQIAERRRLTAAEEQRRGIALLESGDEITALETLARSAAELPPAARAESQYRIGAVYARRGEFARAAPFFRAALEEPGADPELRRRAGYALAVGHFNNGEYQPALALLEDVTASARGSWLAAAHFAQAAGLYRLERAAEAAAHFGLAAVAYDSREAQGELIAGAAEGSAALARTWQALALFRDGDLAAARTLFRQLAADRESGPHWYRAGLASALLEQHDTAEEEFLTALEAVPVGDSLRPAIQYELARLHLAAGDLSAAEAWLERLAAAQPGHRLAAIGRLQLADALRAGGESRAAIAAYHVAIAASGAGAAEAGPPVAELARYSILQLLAELDDGAALAEEAWNYLIHHPAGARVEQVSERFRAVVAGAGPDTARAYYRRATGAQGSAEATPAAADAARLAYGEALIAGDPGAAEPVLLEVVEEGSDDARIAAYLLLGRTYEAAEDWPRAISLYRGLALADDTEVASHGALGVARALAASGDPAAAGEEYGAAAIRFADDQEVAGEAWLRGAEAWREAGDESAAARFVSQLRERFPDSIWAARAAEQFPPEGNHIAE
jgi:tetratricopeptide (TPR) repeat protein